jgi:hypothetical protein
MSPRAIPQQLGSVAALPARRRVERLILLITERNATGRVTLEVEAEGWLL